MFVPYGSYILLKIISAEKVWKRFGMISYSYKTLTNLVKTQTFYTFLQHFSYIFLYAF